MVSVFSDLKEQDPLIEVELQIGSRRTSKCVQGMTKRSCDCAIHLQDGQLYFAQGRLVVRVVDTKP